MSKNIALIFEKASTCTRIAFEVAAYDPGANGTYLGPTGAHIGHKESMRDIARVLGVLCFLLYGEGVIRDSCSFVI